MNSSALKRFLRVAAAFGVFAFLASMTVVRQSSAQFSDNKAVDASVAAQDKALSAGAGSANTNSNAATGNATPPSMADARAHEGTGCF